MNKILKKIIILLLINNLILLSMENELVLQQCSKSPKSLTIQLVDLIITLIINDKVNYESILKSLNDDCQGLIQKALAKINKVRAIKKTNNLKQYQIKSYKVNNVLFSHDSRYVVVTSSIDSIPLLYDIENSESEKKYQLIGHTKKVLSIVFSPYDNYILTGSADNKVILWDITNLDNIIKYEFNIHNGPVNSVAFSSDTKYILTGSSDNTSKLCDIQDLNVLNIVHTFNHQAAVDLVAFSSGGNYIGIQSDDIINLYTIDLKKNFQLPGLNYLMLFSTSDKYMLTCAHENSAKCILWDIKDIDKVELYDLIGHDASISSMTFAPDDRFVLTGSYDNTTRLWDISDLENIKCRELYRCTKWVDSIAISTCGQYILTGSFDNIARLWDIKDLNNIISFEFKDHTEPITFVEFSQNGQYILTGSKKGVVILLQINQSDYWSLKDLIELSRIKH